MEARLQGIIRYTPSGDSIPEETWRSRHRKILLSLALISNWYSIERSREQSEARLQQVAEQTDRIERVEEAKAEAEEAKAEADVRREEVEQLNQHLETKVDAYSTTMARAADGVLTARLDTESDSEAMTRIGEAFNEMIDEIDAARGTIQTFSREVSAASEQTTTGVTGAEEASEQVSRSIESISMSADDQREMLEDVSGEINSLSATIEEAAASAQTETTVGEVRTADQHIREGADAVKEVADSLSSVANNTEETNRGIQEINRATDDQTASMEETVAMIEPVADISRTTAEEAEGVSATAADQVSSMRQVSSESESLSEQADQFQGLLADFEVGGTRA